MQPGHIGVRVVVAPWFFEWCAGRARRGKTYLLRDDPFIRFMLYVATEAKPT